MCCFTNIAESEGVNPKAHNTIVSIPSVTIVNFFSQSITNHSYNSAELSHDVNVMSSTSSRGYQDFKMMVVLLQMTEGLEDVYVNETL